MLHDPAAEADHRKRFRAPYEVLRAGAVLRVPATWTPPTAAHGWHIFPLQDQAFAFADGEDNLSKEKRSCWAEELDGTGRRRYVVASRADFWRRYRKLRCDAPRDAASRATTASPACSRHYYEIIREGDPCHLHLDLEFATASNLAADGERMVATLRHELLGAPNTHYSVPTTHHSLRTTHHSLRATHHSPLTTTTHTIHYPLPMTHDPPGALVDLALALALALARPSPSPKSSSNSNPLALARTPTPTLTRCARR